MNLPFFQNSTDFIIYIACSFVSTSFLFVYQNSEKFNACFFLDEFAQPVR